LIDAVSWVFLGAGIIGLSSLRRKLQAQPADAP